MHVLPSSPYSQDNSHLSILRLSVAFCKLPGTRARPPGGCVILTLSMSELGFLSLPGTVPDNIVGTQKTGRCCYNHRHPMTLHLCTGGWGVGPEVWRSSSASEHQAGILLTYSLSHPSPLRLYLQNQTTF